jgi:hypothetical protein
MLDFTSLWGTNMVTYQQKIHRRLWMFWGLLRTPRIALFEPS